MSVLSSLNILLGMNVAGVTAGAKQTRSDLKGMETAARGADHALRAIGVGIGLYETVDFLRSSTAEYQRARAEGKKLDAVIKSTGGAAGFTSEQLKGLAASLQRVTNFDDDATIGAEAVLATFTKINGLNFATAIERIQDISAVLGQDLQSSAVQVGKALNDPIRGITALRRVGVSFTTDQEAVIKKLVETGQVAKAQEVILAELAVEFGGAARAMRDELTGLANDWGDLKESIGEAVAESALLPKLAAEVRGISQAMQQGLYDKNGDFAPITNFIGHALDNLHELEMEAQRAEATKKFLEQQAANRPAGPTMSAADLAAAEAHDDALEAADKLIARLREEIALQGQTGTAREIAALRLKGLTAAEAQQAQALARENEYRKEAAAAAQRLQENVASLTQRLYLQVRTFGMTSQQAELYELRLRGATDAQLAFASAAQQQLAAMEAQKQAFDDLREAQEEMSREADQIWEQTRTPAEKYAAELERLNELLDAGELDDETYVRARNQATKRYDEAGGTPKGNIQERYDQYTEEKNRLEELLNSGALGLAAFVKLRDQAYARFGKTPESSKKQTTDRRDAGGAGAAILRGSAEALHTLSQLQAGGSTQEKSLAELREIRRALQEKAKSDRRKEQPATIRQM